MWVGWYYLELKRSEETPAVSTTRSSRHATGTHEMDSDSSVEEFEDASEDLNVEDDIFSEAPATNRIKYLSKGVWVTLIYPVFN